MENDLKHIDRLYKNALKSYEPDTAKKFGWGKLWMKLLIFNLGGWTLAAATVILIGTTGIVVHKVTRESNKPAEVQVEKIKETKDIINILSHQASKIKSLRNHPI